ncbi:hypothetical protein M5C99_11795 [Acidovorax sp. NCPPB 2350]|nr:hypothetical protein M5C99_11795 [Acidovorax sp. NCPPB 2350]
MTRTSAQGALVDMRGFSYALVPYLRKQEWQMERLEGQLVKLQHAIAMAKEERRSADAAFQAQAAHLQRNVHARPDPRAHLQGLAYLADMRRQMDVQDREIEALCDQRVQLQGECLAQQRAIDGLLEHRSDAMQHYVQEALRLAAAEADRDWIGRVCMRSVRSGSSP